MSPAIDLHPDQTSRSHAWAGVVADLHWWRGAGEATAEAPQTDLLAMRVAGTSPLVQRRDGKVDERVVSYGNVTIHPRGLRSHWSWTRPGAILLMRAPAALVSEVHARSGDSRDLPNCFGVLDATVELHVRQLVGELHRPSHPSQAMHWESLSLSLLAHVVKRYAGRSVPEPVAAARLSTVLIAKVDAFVQDHWQQPIALQELADLAGLSRYHFARRFKQSVGMTPMAFVERARLDRARALLRDTRRGIADIAALTGFSDQSHFSRRFRRAFAVTPGQFVRAYRPHG